MEKLLTITDLAKLLSVHPDTIRKWEDAGYINSIKTLGGHRRYPQSEADFIMHQMKFPKKTWAEIANTFQTMEDKAWSRKDNYLRLKRFITAHKNNPDNENNIKEIYSRKGTEKVIEILDTFNDEDWKSIDKIDEKLKCIYSWYWKYHTFYWESQLYFLMCDTLKSGTRKSLKNKIDVTKETILEEESHYQNILKQFDMKQPSLEELNIIGYQLDGVRHALCGFCSGISSECDEKDILNGKGLFPHERKQMELDKKNGWDGVSDFTKQRNKLIQEDMIKTMFKVGYEVKK